MPANSWNPFGEAGVLNPWGTNFLAADTVTSGLHDQTQPVETPAQYQADPAGRNAALQMFQSGGASADQFSTHAPGAYQGAMPWAGPSQFGGAAPAQQPQAFQPPAVQMNKVGGGGPVVNKAGGSPPAVNGRPTGPLAGPRIGDKGGAGWGSDLPNAQIRLPVAPEQDAIIGTTTSLDRPREWTGGLNPTMEAHMPGSTTPVAPATRGPVIANNTFGNWLGGYGQDRAEQINSANLARSAALGEQPSVAELQLRQGGEQNLRNSFALQNSGRGNALAGLANAANSANVQGQQLNQNQAILRAGEMAHARDQWGNQLQGIAGNDIGVAQTGGQLDLSAQQGNQGAGLQFAGQQNQARQGALTGILGYDQLAADSYYRPAELRMSAEEAAKGRRGGLLGGGLNALGGILGL